MGYIPIQSTKLLDAFLNDCDLGVVAQLVVKQHVKSTQQNR